ncbi:MAG: type II toxin-antitoxin system RelE/ParE family toxin [Magnetococcales bacterium]|nr:type II toxin-antitoxin system RelE/ParE family toxin [Magnetococcales bacterium]
MNLDTAVVSTQSAQPLDSPGKLEKSLITNKVTWIFSSSPDKPICCTAYALPTAESRLKQSKLKVLMTPPARNDLLDIRAYFAEDNPLAAKKTLELIQAKCSLLAQSPGVGICRDHYQNLHMFPVGRYLIFYRPSKNGVEIIRELHSSKDVESLL